MKRIGLLALIGLVAASCLGPAGIRYPGLPQVEDGALHVIVFDVGQADAMLVLYRGKSLLVDCGSPLRAPMRASQRIPRRLDALLGSRHLDYFMISHYHADHFGSPSRGRRRSAGIFSLIERDGVTIGTLLDRGFWTVNGFKPSSQQKYEEAVRGWTASGIVGERRTVRAGDRIDMGEGLDVRVTVAAGNGYLDRLATLYPTFVAENPPSENDYSIGLTVKLGEFELFTAGDLSGANVVRQFGRHSLSYNDIESQVADAIGAVEVYRVNHHGSSHSSNPCFCQVLRPQVSVVSTGRNRYGHPDPEVYDRLKALGDVYITGGADEDAVSSVAQDIVGDDVEVLVAPDGAAFWVNSDAFRSLSDAEEAARPGSRSGCVRRDPDPASPDRFDRQAGAIESD